MKMGGPVPASWVFAGLALGMLAWGPARAQDVAVADHVRGRASPIKQGEFR